jgi:hypothetical protein
MPRKEIATASTATWVTVIDGWVRDPKIRTDALIALAMVLAAAAITVALATGAVGTTVDVLLPSVLSKLIAAAGGASAGGTLIWWARHRRHGQDANAQEPLPSGQSPSPAQDGSALETSTPITDVNAA